MKLNAMQLNATLHWLLLLFGLLPGHGIAQAGGVLPGSLVSADWLQDKLEQVVLLDVRKDVDSFLGAGHIKGAIPVDARSMRVDRQENGHTLTGMLPDRSQYEAFMSEHGVANDSAVVITHPGEKAGDVTGAARLYWQMKYYGFENLALLDGGNRAWVDARGDLTTEATVVRPARLVAETQHDELLATRSDVLAALNDESIQMIDTRNLRFHIGLDKRDYVSGFGHIPGSKLLPYEFLHPEQGARVYYSVEVITEVLRALQIDTDKSFILYCNSACECSSVWFALHELVGKSDVRVYDGSLNEWTMDARYPMSRVINL